MSKQFSSSDFKQLKNEWYEKLKQTGFNDIEDSGKELRLKLYEINKNKIKGIIRESQCGNLTLEYYIQAEYILNGFEFQNELHRKIWELHCQGLGCRPIADIVARYKYRTISNIIKKIAKDAGLIK